MPLQVARTVIEKDWPGANDCEAWALWKQPFICEVTVAMMPFAFDGCVPLTVVVDPPPLELQPMAPLAVMIPLVTKGPMGAPFKVQFQ